MSNTFTIESFSLLMPSLTRRCEDEDVLASAVIESNEAIEALHRCNSGHVILSIDEMC